MDLIGGMRVKEVFCVYMQYGDDFHECIERVALEKGIQAGAVLCGAGTFDKARIHYVTHTEFPPKDKMVEVEGPIELCSVGGVIAEQKPHLHCTLALRGGELLAGHLERGCRVLYLAEAVVAKFSGKELMRDVHPEHGTARLRAKAVEKAPRRTGRPKT